MGNVLGCCKKQPESPTNSSESQSVLNYPYDRLSDVNTLNGTRSYGTIRGQVAFPNARASLRSSNDAIQQRSSSSITSKNSRQSIIINNEISRDLQDREYTVCRTAYPVLYDSFVPAIRGSSSLTHKTQVNKVSSTNSSIVRSHISNVERKSFVRTTNIEEVNGDRNIRTGFTNTVAERGTNTFPSTNGTSTYLTRKPVAIRSTSPRLSVVQPSELASSQRRQEGDPTISNKGLQSILRQTTKYTNESDARNIAPHQRQLNDLVHSALVNSIHVNDDDDDDDDGYVIPQNVSCSITFTNQQNQNSNLPFKQYVPSREIQNFFNNDCMNIDVINSKGKHLEILIEKLKRSNHRLIENNYLDALLLFADLEDLHCENAVLVYNRSSEKIEPANKANNYIIYVPNLVDSRPTISVFGRIKINSNNIKYQIFGTILKIQPKFIVVEIFEKFDTNLLYDVHFLSNRTTFRMEKLAVELMKQKNLISFMFPIKEMDHCSKVSNRVQQFTWFNKSVAKNPEQQTVIDRIYHGTSHPYPYILFGPPGTGKTATLVEAILQLWQNKINTRILIIATSNPACNVITKRLLQYVPSTEMFRLFSKSQEEVVDKIDIQVLSTSNLKDQKYYIPKPDELYPYRIIIATPTASGRLILDRFDCGHFTHLFIDECGSCTEGSTLIPIAGLISSRNSLNANIVLAGDPLQLRPVIFSRWAEKLGYGVSMIERLMELSMYKKDKLTGEYNNNYITKLRLNYRSHKDILQISNQLFYDNELLAVGSKDVTDRMLKWPHLLNPKFPLMFHAVFGKSLSEQGSPSLFNKQEINVVMSYLRLLVNQNLNGKVVRQTDIGVISPYRRQNQKIRSQCDYRKWNDIEVASVEAFQGNEKSIIILSTVRSDVDIMGFLSNERRLNVALTRAQGLLIMVGDPKVLMQNNCWYQLIKFCYDNRAICGEPFDFYS